LSPRPGQSLGCSTVPIPDIGSALARIGAELRDIAAGVVAELRSFAAGVVARVGLGLSALGLLLVAVVLPVLTLLYAAPLLCVSVAFYVIHICSRHREV
jgi:hypothetical protein